MFVAEGFGKEELLTPPTRGLTVLTLGQREPHALCIGRLMCLLVALRMHAEKRQAEAARIRDKYPDRIPVSFPVFVHDCSPGQAFAAAE